MKDYFEFTGRDGHVFYNVYCLRSLFNLNFCDLGITVLETTNGRDGFLL